MASGAVGVHTARVPFGAMAAGGAMDPTIPLAPVAAFVQPPHIDDAVALLADAPVSVIGIGFTSSSYVLGAAGETAVVRRLSERTGGMPVIATCAAAVDGLRRLGTSRIALISPPWFDAGLDALGAEYFSAQNFDVVFHAPCGLPSGQTSIHPAELHEWVRTHVPSDAESVFIGGNGFRSVGVIEALEEALRIPVLTANQALFWSMLRSAKSPVTPRRYGRLFDVSD